jgi:hypothetical protein
MSFTWKGMHTVHTWFIVTSRAPLSHTNGRRKRFALLSDDPPLGKPGTARPGSIRRYKRNTLPKEAGPLVPLVVSTGQPFRVVRNEYPHSHDVFALCTAGHAWVDEAAQSFERAKSRFCRSQEMLFPRSTSLSQTNYRILVTSPGY